MEPITTAIRPSPQPEPHAAPRTDFLKVTDFNFFYGKKQALYNINMEIPERQVTAFIGPSGCGKSTLLRNFNRMNDLIDGVQHEGDILLNGRSIYDPEDRGHRPAPQHRHGLPEVESLPEVDLRKHRLLACASPGEDARACSMKPWSAACAAPPFGTK